MAQKPTQSPLQLNPSIQRSAAPPSDYAVARVGGDQVKPAATMERQKQVKTGQPKQNLAQNSAQSAEQTAESRSESRRLARAEAVESLRRLQEVQQKRQVALNACEILAAAEHDSLQLAGYPDATEVWRARRRREIWFFGCFICVGIFIASWLEVAPAWAGGSALGLLALVLLFGLTPLRGLIIADPSAHDLSHKRKALEFKALAHIRLMEESGRMAFQCSKLAPYNSELTKPTFSRLMSLSRRGELMRTVKSRRHIRLYWMLLIEAEKAYQRLKQEYRMGNREVARIESRIDRMDAESPPTEKA